jgi:hypothetical protein
MYDYVLQFYTCNAIAVTNLCCALHTAILHFIQVDCYTELLIDDYTPVRHTNGIGAKSSSSQSSSVPYILQHNM